MCLVLGDNIFYGQDFSSKLKIATSKSSGATIFGYEVSDPARFGVVEFDKNKIQIINLFASCPQAASISFPLDFLIVTGILFFSNS